MTGPWEETIQRAGSPPRDGLLENSYQNM